MLERDRIKETIECIESYLVELDLNNEFVEREYIEGMITALSMITGCLYRPNYYSCKVIQHKFYIEALDGTRCGHFEYETYDQAKNMVDVFAREFPNETFSIKSTLVHGRKDQ